MQSAQCGVVHTPQHSVGGLEAYLRLPRGLWGLIKGRSSYLPTNGNSTLTDVYNELKNSYFVISFWFV